MFNYTELPDDKLEFVAVAAVDALGDGERLIVEIDGAPIAIFNLAGKYFAIDDVCSHDEGPLAEGEISGRRIACPRHGAQFDLESGKALTLPAAVDIAAYPVRLNGGEIWIGLPVEVT